MSLTDRRSFLRGVLSGAAVVAAGFALLPEDAEAVPLATAKVGPGEIDDLVEKAQVVVVPGRRRRRAVVVRRRPAVVVRRRPAVVVRRRPAVVVRRRRAVVRRPVRRRRW